MSYVTASEYLGMYNVPKSNMVTESYIQHPEHELKYENEPIKEGYTSDNNTDNDLNMIWDTKKINNTADPRVWGPAFWFTLHNSAAHYPYEASPIVKERMKWRILALPYEIPCAGCRPHASAFVEQHKHKLDQIVSGRHRLGKFYVDFHNQVNKRHGKRQWTYDEAYKLYSGGVEITYLKYK